jgi:hypothetical protein
VLLIPAHASDPAERPPSTGLQTRFDLLSPKKIGRQRVCAAGQSH